MSPSLKGKLIAGFIFAFLAGSATGAFFAIHQARHWRDAIDANHFRPASPS